MATTGNDKAASGIPPKEPSHVHPNPLSDLPVGASQPTYGEPQRYDDVGESSHAAPQHAWPQRLQNVGMHSAEPLNNFAAKMGSESFMPVTMDKECEKAARILRGFCKDGIYHDAEHQPPAGPAQLDESSRVSGHPSHANGLHKSKHHTILTIPSKVIAGAVGLAIFTTARAGFHVSGSAGSGILVARLPDGSWSPPSGILVHSLGAGFLVGVDICDCVCVINTREALETFMKTRLSLGPELSVVAGPFGAGGRMDFAAPTSEHDAAVLAAAEDTADGRKFNEPRAGLIHEALKKPVYSYVNSRGFYVGVQVDGTVITERKDGNAAFYGENIPVEKILRGEVPAQGPAGMWPAGARTLMEVMKGAANWHGSHMARGEGGI